MWDRVAMRGLPVVAPGEPIYEHLRSLLDASGRLVEVVDLPDDERDPTKIHWAPGTRDGVPGRHGAASEQTARVVEVARLLSEACREPSEERLRALYAAVVEDDVVSYVDTLIELLPDGGAPAMSVHEIGWWLATTAPDRGPVKLGIALLGATMDVVEDFPREVVRVLGAHDEFTLYAAVVLAQLGERELWELAKIVDGWGRIACVERLEDTADPEIRDWILRSGFRNSIMDEYLAYIGATTGGLLAALRAPDIDRDLLTAAGDILRSLAQGGPAEDMSHYEEAAEALAAYLALVEHQGEEVTDFLAVRDIQRYLKRADTEMAGKEAFIATCERVLAPDRWRDRVAVAVAGQERVWHAVQVAAKIGVDVAETVFGQLERDPSSLSWWYEAWEQVDAASVPRLVDLARTALPLAEITTGPADELGIGPLYRAHSALELAVRGVRDHPGLGADLVSAALRSPLVRNRRAALETLEAWPRDAWSTEHVAGVAELAGIDPDHDTRARARALVT